MDVQTLSVAGGRVQARVAVDFGCNLFSWEIDGRELLHCPEGFGTDPESFFHGGTPILFPAVGRTWDRSVTPPLSDRYRLAGCEAELSMPLHGIGPYGSWRVERLEPAGDQARLVCRFAYPPDVQSRHYPFAVELVQEFILHPTVVEFRARLRNVGKDAAPYAFGYHPYLRLISGKATIDLPCRRQLELVPELLVPDGDRSRPATFPIEIRKGVAVDAVFTMLTDRCAMFMDHDSSYALRLQGSEDTHCFVLYADPSGRFVCIEPWTRGLGQYEKLRRPNWADALPLNVLLPNRKRTFSMWLSYLPFPSAPLTAPGSELR
jgi:galactose mutarotase-like enzyme